MKVSEEKKLVEDLISVIVPVYNAENTIMRCINSILQQENVSFEIIVVDDGSKDGSFKLCQELSVLHKEIRIYHTENRGVSHARNFGIERAKGTYIVFVDADDELVDGALFQAFKLQKETSADMICWNAISVRQSVNQPYDNFRIKNNLVKKDGILDIQGALYEIPSKKNFFYGTMIRAVWGKLFSIRIIRENKIKFPNLIMGEDAVFLFEYFQYCNIVAFLNKHLYRYYELGDSVTEKYKENYFSIQKREAVAIKMIYEKYKKNPEDALKYFWNVSYMQYIKNEYKLYQNDWKIIRKANRYLKDDMVKKYLIQNKSKSKLSLLKSFLMKYKLTLPVSIIYVCIYKRNHLLQVKNEKC